MAFDDPLSEPVAGSDMEALPRRPFWLLGLALLGLVGVLLGGALLLDRQLRPPVGTQPVAGDRVPVMTPPAMVVAAPTTEPTTSPTTTPEPTAQPTIAPTATPATTQPTQVLAVTEKAALEREVQEAYLNYWGIRVEAYFNLDTSRLSEVMSGAELQREIEQIRELQGKGRAGKLDVEHSILVAKVSQEEAIVYDEYLNRSVFLDAATKQILPTKAAPTVEKVSYQMRRFEDGWKVVDGLQQD